MSIALIIPALNEEAALPLLAARIPDLIDDVILVDNGSTDQTSQVARELGWTVVHEPTRGYGAAVWTGILACNANIVVFASADGSDPVEEVGQITAPIAVGSARLVMAKRIAEAGDLTKPQAFGNWLACALIQLRWRTHFTDLGPFRALRRTDLLELNMQDRGFGWTVEMQAKVAARRWEWQEIPLPYYPRQAGKSKISGTVRGTIVAGRAILWTIAKLAFRTRP